MSDEVDHYIVVKVRDRADAMTTNMGKLRKALHVAAHEFDILEADLVIRGDRRIDYYGHDLSAEREFLQSMFRRRDLTISARWL